MKCSCTKENLLFALNKVGGVTGKNLNLPILNNVLFKASQQGVDVSATNLDLGITVALRSVVEEPGSFTVPARTITDFISLLSEDKVDLEVKENELVIRCGKTTTKIKGTSAEDYPIIPAIENGQEFKLDASEFKFGLSQVLSSVAKNDIRPELSGVFFGFNVYNKPGLTLAATDSYRLAQKIVSLADGSKEELRVIVPGKTAQEIYRLLTLGVPSAEEIDQKVRLIINGNQLQLHYGTVTLVSRLTEGQYPDYVQIIPSEFKTTALIPTDQFIKEVKGAGLFTTTGVNAVSCVLEPEKSMVQLSSTSTQTGEYVSEIGGEVKGEKNNILLSFRYVLEGLQHVSSPKVMLKVINADSPCILVPDGDSSFLYIVMPIRQ